jgi:hypothetical protein
VRRPRRVPAGDLVIPLSPRYSLAAFALIASAVLVVALHRAFAANHDPCANPDQISRLAAYGSDFKVVPDHKATGDRIPQLRVSGTLPPAVPGGAPLEFRVARAAEPYPIYARTFLSAAVLPEDQIGLRELRVGSDVLPVHRVFGDTLGAIRLTRYFLVQGVTPVARLLPSGIASAWSQLVSGTQPVTAFAVTAIAEPEALAAAESATEAWLSAAWSDFQRACQP